MPNYRIIVDLSDRTLYLLDGDQVTKSYPVGIGKMLTSTPTGEYRIINKQMNPGGPFGVLWMGLSKPHYGIHDMQSYVYVHLMLILLLIYMMVGAFSYHLFLYAMLK